MAARPVSGNSRHAEGSRGAAIVEAVDLKETLLRKPEYRQKVAEAVERAVERYAGGLSHFQVAQNK